MVPTPSWRNIAISQTTAQNGLLPGSWCNRLFSPVTYRKVQKSLAITFERAYDQSMNRKIFWTIFVVVQSIGAAVILLVAHLPIALVDRAFPFAVVCLCPGLFVSTWLLDAPQLPSEDGGIVSLAIVLNAIFWFGVFATIREIRRRSTSRA